MKVYLHYPRIGETILINGVQFINGVADMPYLHTYFERYYEVKDYPPREEIDITPVDQGVVTDVQPIVSEDTIDITVAEESEPSGEEMLRMVVESRKATIEAKANTPDEPVIIRKSLVEQYLALDNQGKRIGFMKDKTGKVIRGRDEAVAYLTEIDKQNGF